MQYLNTEARLSIVNAKRSIAIHQAAPSEYIHILQEKPDLMQKISNEIKAVFGKDLIINFCGGEQVRANASKSQRFFAILI